MHPALDPSRLNDLPPSLRRIALSAANGSDVDFQRLAARIRSNNIPDYQSRLFASLFYANLDPAEIIGGGGEDLITQYSLHSISLLNRAFESLDLFISIPMPHPTAYPELWARAWPWIELFYTTKDTNGPLQEQSDLYFVLLKFITNMMKQDAEPMLSTPGVRILVSRAWAIFLDSGDQEGLSLVGYWFTVDKNKHGPDHMDEFAQGAGGTLSDLAALVVRYIKHGHGDGRSLTESHLSVLSIASKFLLDTGDTTSTTDGPYSPYEAALLAHGLVGTITTVVYTLNALPLPIPSLGRKMIGNYVTHLCQYGLIRPGHVWMLQALQAKLLPALVLCSKLRADDIPNRNILQDLERIVSIPLASCLVYRSFLLQLGPALRDVAYLVDTPRFRASDLFPVWQEFTKLVQERLVLLENAHSSESERFGACDNSECAQIQPRSDFRRCSSCRASTYCSRSCQTADWRAGHREICQVLRSQTNYDIDSMTTSGMHYLRAVVTSDYLAARFDIFVQKVAILAAHSETTTPLLYTEFYYRRGRARVTVHKMSDLSNIAGTPVVASWTGRTHGRGEVYMVITAEGEGGTLRFFRGRCTTADIHDGLVTLAGIFAAEMRAQGVTITPDTSLEDKAKASEIVRNGIQRLLDIEAVTVIQ
ncbi:hypothetical protein C8R43DRAFT_1232544 [Mycena crocata]|nr:hypothetical protein C8R43DRAFT_1232544 [Mycena crocata]